MYSPLETICVGIGEASASSTSSAGGSLVSCSSLNQLSASRESRGHFEMCVSCSRRESASAAPPCRPAACARGDCSLPSTRPWFFREVAVSCRNPAGTAGPGDDTSTAVWDPASNASHSSTSSICINLGRIPDPWSNDALAVAFLVRGAHVCRRHDGVRRRSLVAAAGPGGTIVVVAGDQQSAEPGTTLPQPLVVQVNDPTAKGVPGVRIRFFTGGDAGLVSGP